MTAASPSADPALTVVMPCFDAMPYLVEAIESVRRQSYAGFEFVIYDDGSSDGSYETALDFAAKDSRIRVLRGAERQGPVASSRAAARATTTPFVARMDADDVARPDRLELQLKALLSVPEASVVGALYTFIDASGTELRPSNRGQLLGRRGARPLLIHPSLMYRREMMERVGGYREGTELIEDRDLIARLCAAGPMLIVPEPLLQIRMAGQGFRARGAMRELEEKLLGAAPADARAGAQSVEPRVYRTIALVSIYRDTRPRMLLRALRRMDLRQQGAAKALLLLALATIQPRLARACIRVAAAWNDRRAARSIAPLHLFCWFQGALRDLGPGFREVSLPVVPCD